MKRATIITSVLLLLINLRFFWEARNFPPPMNIRDVGAHYFPTLIIILMSILCLILIVKVLVSRNGDDEGFSLPKKTILGMGIVIAYAVLMPVIGYTISTGLVILAVMYLMEIRNIKLLLGTTIGFIVFAQILFFRILGVMPPTLY